MTEEIRTYIEQIRTKSRELHQSLVVERERVGSCELEIKRLEELLKEQETTMGLLKSHADSLQQSLDEQREQVRLQKADEESKDLEIDGLVKEIDFCIQQLKMANE